MEILHGPPSIFPRLVHLVQTQSESKLREEQLPFWLDFTPLFGVVEGMPSVIVANVFISFIVEIEL